MRRTSRIITTICILTFAGSARAAELHVPDDYNTIQAAIDAAHDGDTVIIADGTYTGDGNRDIDFLGKAITVKSESGPENCIIDCNGTEDERHRAFYLHSGERANSVIEGITLTNGWASSGGGVLCYASNPTIINCTVGQNNGGGIWCEGSSPTISGCIIRGNYGGRRGGGITCMADSSPRISRCIIEGNSSERFAGGIWCEQSSPTISGCIIRGNYSARLGGGVSCREDSRPRISTCIIEGNSSERFGGGILCHHRSRPRITDCIIRGNEAKREGGAIYCISNSGPVIVSCAITGNSAKEAGGILCYHHSGPVIFNCAVTGNSAEIAGGIVCGYDSDAVIVNSTIAGNLATIYQSGGIDVYESDARMTNCIIRDNWPEQIYGISNSSPLVTYSNIEADTDEHHAHDDGIWTGEGNIDADPCFVEPGYWDVNGVWVEGDYRLLATSPCIDAGDPNYVAEPNETDLDGNPRVIGERIDMGAYEYIPPLVAQVRISPRSLNLQSKGRWVSCYIVLPEDYDVADIDPNSILLEDEIAPDRVVSYGRLAVAKFSRSAVQELLSELQTPGEVELLVSGQLTDGTIFEGTDTISIKRPPMMRKSIKEAQARRLRRNNKSI